MKGAMPPAATDDVIAGVSNTSFRLGVRNEKSSLNVGAGGEGEGSSWTDAVGEGVSSKSCFLISTEARVDDRTDSSEIEGGIGSWLFIVVADDEEPRLSCCELREEERKCVFYGWRCSFLLSVNGELAIVLRHCRAHVQRQ